MAVNFVKFQRGSVEAYGLLRDRNRVDPDTLYFLYDEANPENGGDLYLGYTLIGGTSSSSGAVTSLRQLTDDVSITGSLKDGMLLQYMGTRGKWVSRPVAEVLAAAGISSGASVTVETAVPEGSTISSVLTTIADPKEGDIAVIAGNPYVYDGSDWVSLTNSNVLDRISNLETEISNIKSSIQAVRSEIDTKIAQANHLTYKKLSAGQTLNDIDTTASDIDRTVFLVPTDDSDTNNKYYEYMYVDGQFEKIGSWATNLSGYVTQTALNTAVGNLQDQINQFPSTFVTLQKYNNEIGSISDIITASGKSSTTVSAEIVEIENRLKWNPIPSV